MNNKNPETESKALDEYTSTILSAWSSGTAVVPLEKDFCQRRGYSSAMLESLMASPIFMESFKKMKDVQENLLTAGALMGRFKGDFALRALEQLSGWMKEQAPAVQANIQINSFDLKKVEAVMNKLMAMNSELQLKKEVGEINITRGGQSVGG